MSITPLAELDSQHLRIEGKDVVVRVWESPRARVARIIVGPRRPLSVVIPEGMADAEVAGFLHQKQAWIAQKLETTRAILDRPAVLELDRPNTVWLNGRAVAVQWTPGARAVARRNVDGGAEIPLHVGGATHDDAVAAIERWYRREARRVITDVASRHADRLGLTFSSISVRDQKTRWGSCSRKGNLSLSWRLLIAPREVLEYVVVHELCHLREPSHSKRYWRLLETSHPGWQEQARWLREHAQELHEFTPAVAR